jgi:hypothetical protein
MDRANLGRCNKIGLDIFGRPDNNGPAVSATSDSTPAGSVAATEYPIHESVRIVPSHETDAIVMAEVPCVQARLESATALAARRQGADVYPRERGSR